MAKTKLPAGNLLEIPTNCRVKKRGKLAEFAYNLNSIYYARQNVVNIANIKAILLTC